MTQSSNMKLRPVGITGIGAYVPERILTNTELATINQLSDEWIRQRTGVQERRICTEHQATTDLAVPAAEMALRSAGIKPEGVHWKRPNVGRCGFALDASKLPSTGDRRRTTSIRMGHEILCT